MRALLVCASPSPGATELVAELARHCDLLVGVDGGAAVCESAGLTPDLVVGDLDSLDAAAVARLEAAGAVFERFSSRKDETDLDLALTSARHHGATLAVVTAAYSGRLDHTLAAVGSLARAADLAPEIAEPELRGWLLTPGVRSELALSGPGATISLVAVTGDATVSVAGVDWPLTRALLAPLSSLGVSNVIAEVARVAVHDGCILVLSPRVDGIGPASTTS